MTPSNSISYTRQNPPPGHSPGHRSSFKAGCGHGSNIPVLSTTPSIETLVDNSIDKVKNDTQDNWLTLGLGPLGLTWFIHQVNKCENGLWLHLALQQTICKSPSNPLALVWEPQLFPHMVFSAETKMVNSHLEMNVACIFLLNHRLHLSSFTDLHTLGKNVLRRQKTN